MSTRKSYYSVGGNLFELVLSRYDVVKTGGWNNTHLLSIIYLEYCTEEEYSMTWYLLVDLCKKLNRGLLKESTVLDLQYITINNSNEYEDVKEIVLWL
jgi:hypothetical protein